METEFDPYQQWLGIAPSQFPINHYRLLGIRPFESDPAVIAAAADRRMLAIRRHQTGPRGAATQQILNEISNAKICLLNDAARTSYDEMLKGLAAATRDAPSSTAISEIVTPNLQLGEQRSKRLRAATPYYRRPFFPVVALAAILAIALVVWTIGISMRPTPPRAGGSPADKRSGEPVPNVTAHESPPDVEQVIIQQEARGDINFSPGLARLRGNSLKLSFFDVDEVLTGWGTEQDIASWRFIVRKLPSQGVFRAKVTYAGEGERSYLLAVDGKEVAGYTRANDDFVTDEHFVQLSMPGEHELTIRAAGAQTLRIKWITLAFPDR